jgi:hypothetical protein
MREPRHVVPIPFDNPGRTATHASYFAKLQRDSREDPMTMQHPTTSGGGDTTPRHGPLSLAIHARIDAAILTAVLVSPWLLGYAQHKGATIMAVACFAVGMGLNLVTDYPLGILKLIPMKLHRLAEITSPPMTLVVPWIFFADAGAFPWVMTFAGLAVLANTLLTRPVPG